MKQTSHNAHHGVLYADIFVALNQMTISKVKLNNKYYKNCTNQKKQMILIKTKPV